MNRLKELRKQKRMTQYDVAEYIGIAQSSYWAWENEKANIDNTSLYRLSALFGVSVDYLLGVEAEQTKKPGILSDDELLKLLDGLTPENLEKVRSFAAYLSESKSEQ